MSEDFRDNSRDKAPVRCHGTGGGRFRVFPFQANPKGAAADIEGDHVVETTTEARGAVSGQQVRYVLAFGTVGCAILFVAVYLYFFS